MRKMKTDGQTVTSIWECDNCDSRRRATMTDCKDCDHGHMVFHRQVSGLVLVVWSEEPM